MCGHLAKYKPQWGARVPFLFLVFDDQNFLTNSNKLSKVYKNTGSISSSTKAVKMFCYPLNYHVVQQNQVVLWLMVIENTETSQSSIRILTKRKRALHKLHKRVGKVWKSGLNSEEYDKFIKFFSVEEFVCNFCLLERMDYPILEVLDFCFCWSCIFFSFKYIQCTPCHYRWGLNIRTIFNYVKCEYISLFKSVLSFLKMMPSLTNCLTEMSALNPLSFPLFLFHTYKKFSSSNIHPGWVTIIASSGVNYWDFLLSSLSVFIFLSFSFLLPFSPPSAAFLFIETAMEVVRVWPAKSRNWTHLPLSACGTKPWPHSSTVVKRFFFCVP